MTKAEIKFTPGPWEYEQTPNGILFITVPVFVEDTYEGYKDDAQLIAQAAPLYEENKRLKSLNAEMLEALQTMTALCRIKYGNLDKDVYAEIEKSESIIAKATQP